MTVSHFLFLLLKMLIVNACGGVVMKMFMLKKIGAVNNKTQFISLSSITFPYTFLFQEEV